MKRDLLVPLLAGASALLAGCATAPRDAGFGDVRRDVADRTNVELVRWDRGTDADRQAQSSVDALLAKELTPDSAVQVALLNNADLQATYEDLGVAQADLVRGGLLRNPVFDADVKFAEGGNGHLIELSVVQDFLDVFQIPLRKRTAAAALEAAKLRVTGEAVDLAGRVRAAVYELQAAQQSLELRQTVLAAANASSDLARRMGESGNLTRLEVANERATFEQTKLDAAAAETDVLSRRERLNVLLGLWGMRTQWTVAARLPDVPADAAALDDVEKRAVERSLEIQVARAEAQAAASTLGLRRDFALISGLELGAAAERESDGEWSLGPAVSVPIPLFDTGAAGVSAAQAELRRAEKRLRATAVRVRSAARLARDTLIAAHDRAVYYREVVLPLRNEITKQTQLQLNAMAAGPFQLLEAKRREVETAAAMVDAQRDHWLARVRLEQLLTGGRMTEEAVKSAPLLTGFVTPRGAGH